MDYRNDGSTDVNFSVLVGKTIKSIKNENDVLTFETEDGETYRQVYYNDCCASCSIEEIHGDLDDLIGSPILRAEEVSSTEPDALRKASRDAEDAENKAKDSSYSRYDDSETWTFYKAATIKGSVTIRWYGGSNGYYSESPTFEKLGGDNYDQQSRPSGPA